jgi:hypothetical protein
LSFLLRPNATLLVYLVNKSISEYGGIFRLLYKKLKVWWQKIPKKVSKHACLLGSSGDSTKKNHKKGSFFSGNIFFLYMKKFGQVF